MNQFTEYFTSSGNLGLLGIDLLAIAKEQPERGGYLLGDFGELSTFVIEHDVDGDITARGEQAFINRNTLLDKGLQPLMDLTDKLALDANDVVQLRQGLDALENMKADVDSVFYYLDDETFENLDAFNDAINTDDYDHNLERLHLKANFEDIRVELQEFIQDNLDNIDLINSRFDSMTNLNKKNAETDALQRRELQAGIMKQKMNQKKKGKTRKIKKGKMRKKN